MSTENTKLREGYSAVYTMPFMVAGKVNAEIVEKTLEEGLGIHIQYLEEIPLEHKGVTAEEVTKSIEAAAETIAAKMRGDEGADDLPDPEIKGRSDMLIAVRDDDLERLGLMVMFGQIRAIPLSEAWEQGAKDEYPERIAEYLK